MSKRQTASDLGRTLSGQWSKSEKRAKAARSIAEAKKTTHQIIKNFAQQLKMK
jgi:hypothetical protein